MHGYIHLCLESMVVTKGGLDLYKSLLRKAGLNELTEWRARENYGDELTFRLFHNFAAISQQTIEIVLEQFGEWMFSYSAQKYELLLKAQSDSLQGFLDNLSSFHYFLDTVVFQGEAKGPTFRCEPNQDESLTLHYFSDRKGLYPMVKGLVRQASIEMFHQEVTVVVRERLQEKRKNLMGEHIIFSISSDDPKHKLIRPELRPVVLKGRKKTDQVGYISLSIFCQAFPNHICINKQLFIEHCGKFVQDEFDVAGKRLVKINDILVLVQPEDVTMSFKNFLLYLNSPFVFRSKHSLKRNEGKVTKQFLLKGQMCLLNNGEHLLFMGSPYFSTVHELIESNIYISDMQLNDITRDLILLNQNRIAQQEINRKLEEAVNNLQKFSLELAQKRKQIQTMIAEFLPPSVMEEMQSTDGTPAEEYPEVSCLNSDIYQFNLINSKLEANEIVTLINQVFYLFDKLVESHQCCKIYTLADNFFVVAGAPICQPDHAERLLNLGFGFINSVRTLVIPRIQLPLLMRVSIHSGPMVGCVVGTSRRRFYVLSETVNIAKRLTNFSEAGRILITGATKVIASKADEEGGLFTYTPYNFIRFGDKSKAVSTFWVEKGDNSEASIIEKEKTQWMNYYRRFIGLRSFRDKRRNAALVFRKSLQSRQSFDSGICHDGNLNSSSGACNIQ